MDGTPGRPVSFRGASPSLVPSPPEAAAPATRPRHGGLASGPKRRLDGSAAGTAASSDGDHAVRFADVQIREYERVALEPGNDGGPKLGLGWKAKKETFRRLDSLELEVTAGWDLVLVAVVARRAVDGPLTPVGPQLL